MTQQNIKHRYLELLKKSLLNEIYLSDEQRIFYLKTCMMGQDQYDFNVMHDIKNQRPNTHNEFVKKRHIGNFPFNHISNAGFAQSMIGRKRMDSLHHCLQTILDENIAGDLIECGVWRGGAAIFMQGFLKAHEIMDKKVFIADSFQGLPKSDIPDDPDLSSEVLPELAIPLEEVLNNFKLYDLLDDKVIPIKGWFCDTLPTAPIEKLSLLRADGDLYTSTTDILENLYDKVTDGGFIIIDDFYAIASCKRAVVEFFQRRGETLPEMTQIDWTGVYWRKNQEN